MLVSNICASKICFNNVSSAKLRAKLYLIPWHRTNESISTQNKNTPIGRHAVLHVICKSSAWTWFFSFRSTWGCHAEESFKEDGGRHSNKTWQKSGMQKPLFSWLNQKHRQCKRATLPGQLLLSHESLFRSTWKKIKAARLFCVTLCSPRHFLEHPPPVWGPKELVLIPLICC